MTVVLAVRCSEGVVLASDGQVTADAAGQPTKAPARKLFDVGGQLAWGAAGSAGLQQTLQAELAGLNGHATDAEQLRQRLASIVIPIQQQGLARYVPHPGTESPDLAVIFCWCDGDGPRILEIPRTGSDHQFHDRYFDRVYSYLRIALDDEHAAEDSAQQVFLKVMEALPRYERRSQPFRAWLFTVVRNHAIRQLEKRARLELVDPVELNASHGGIEDIGPRGSTALNWVTDRELVMLVERLPVAQRQVLLLRFMMDLATSDIGAVLDRSTEDVRVLQSRALRFLEHRLTALGRAPRSALTARRTVRRARGPGADRPSARGAALSPGGRGSATSP